jgi:hypothetical protein
MSGVSSIVTPLRVRPGPHVAENRPLGHVAAHSEATLGAFLSLSAAGPAYSGDRVRGLFGGLLRVAPLRLYDDGGSFEAEALADSVHDVAFGGEVELAFVIREQHEGRRTH